ncbi:MAG: NUDIX domain-containing protein [Vicinamibacterales bacterium]
MSYEPEKFFIGVIDLFSVLLPGAVLSYLLKDHAAARLGLASGYPLDRTEAAIVFIAASYLMGHFTFLAGSTLDNLIYNPMRALTDWGQIGRLARGKELRPSWLRRVAATFLFSPDPDRAVMTAQRMKVFELEDRGAGRSMNTFQWAKARLSKDHPAGLAAVERFEADSKFFRSFIIVLLVLAAHFLWHQQWGRAAACVATLLPTTWRYVDQRFKATEQAYRFVIVLRDWHTSPVTRKPREGEVTHAGGIVTRRIGGALEVLLVQASEGRDEWVLPKGHIELGERPAEAAVREVREESGHWASVERRLTDQLIPVPGAPALTRFYVMRLVEAGEAPSAEGRRQQWLTVPRAIDLATFPQTRELLQLLSKTSTTSTHTE